MSFIVLLNSKKKKKMFLIHPSYLVVNSSFPVCPSMFKCYEIKGPPRASRDKKAEDNLAEEARRKPGPRHDSSLSHWLWVTQGFLQTFHHLESGLALAHLGTHDHSSRAGSGLEAFEVIQSPI